MGPKTAKWTEVADENKFLESEELLLRNTFINARSDPNSMYVYIQNLAQTQVKKDRKKPGLKWVDIESFGRKPLD